MIKSKTLITIPSYNAEKFIVRTIESCLNQTIQSEIWIIDNCSEDNTQKIVKKYELKDNRVKLIINERNYGRVGNWNICIDLFMKSEYKYLKFVFSGDEILPTCIEEGEKAFAIDDEIGAVAFPYQFIDLKGNMSISRHRESLNKLYTAKEITKKNLGGGMLLGAIICNIYAKKAIKDFRFDENDISKAKFDIKVLENSKAYYLDKTLAIFNLDSHMTFHKAYSAYGYLEFSFIFIKEHERISRTNMFTEIEIKQIEQKIIKNCISQQIRFLTLSNIIQMAGLMLLKMTKRIIKNILTWKTR